MWSTPRLHGTTLSASWQVRPEEATCYYDLLDADGGQAGSGFAETSQEGATGRGIQVEYDPGTAGALESVEIRCSLLGGEAAVSEFQIYRVNYKNRHPDSVLPATDEHYFDHDEIAALFGECRPRLLGGRPSPKYNTPPIGSGMSEVSDQDGDGDVDHNDYLNTRLDFWERTFENWDTQVTDLGGIKAVSGWWTTRQLRMYHPASNITAASARQHAYYDEADRYITLLPWEGLPIEAYQKGYWALFPAAVRYGHTAVEYLLPDLYFRLEDSVGYVNIDEEPADAGVQANLISDDGIAGDSPNPTVVSPSKLLWDWVDARYEYAPVDREPTAWAMRTLLEARDSRCVAKEMRAHCTSGEFHPSRHMRHPDQGGSRLGSVLWSAICPEVSPGAP